MKFMIIVKANADTEAGVMPTTEEFAQMGAFNEQLVKAGVMLAGEGLHPTSNGARVYYENGKARAEDGPFELTGDTIAGFWLLQVKSREEAVEWLKRAPFRSGHVEIRQVFEAEDFGESFTPELREQEERLRAESASRH